MLSNNSRSYFLITSIVLLLTACGGGGDNSSNSNINSNINDNLNNSDNSSNDNLSSALVLQKPSISLNYFEDTFRVFWDDSNASQYRVIYWQGNNPPQQYLTNQLEFTAPELDTSGEYTVIIEAYDDLGNSLFSDPDAIII